MAGHKDQLIDEVAGEIRRRQAAADALDHAACDRMGINRTDARCVDIIDRHGGITAGQLADESGLTTGSVTAMLDRMERDGYVRRVRDDQDRRRVTVELTARMNELNAEIYGPVGMQGRELLQRYSSEQLTMMCNFFHDGAELLDEHGARVRAMGPAMGAARRGPGPTPASRLEAKLEKTRDKVDLKVDLKMSKLERKVDKSRGKLDRAMDQIERRVSRVTPDPTAGD
jgi:DNA-binding MarR family transcriptional regulator